MPQEMSSAQSNEQEIQFKKRARRRLVGAIALVLLMVTVLPMVLDDRAAKAPPQEIAITIPSKDGTDFTSKVIPVAPETAPIEVAPPANENAAPATPDKMTEVPEAEVAKSKDTPAEKPAVAPAVKPLPEPAVENKTAEVNVDNSFAVQIGVFSDAANIKQLQQKLSSAGYKSYTEKVATAKGEKIRLRAGPFESRAEAESALGKIKDTGLSGMVVGTK